MITVSLTVSSATSPNVPKTYLSYPINKFVVALRQQRMKNSDSGCSAINHYLSVVSDVLVEN